MKLIAVIALLVAAAQAVPAQLEARAEYDIQWYKKKHYDGSYKKYSDCDTGKCYNLNEEYDNAASSVKKSSGYTCRYYKKKGCEGDYLNAKGNYEELPDSYDDAISSWKCSKN